MNTKGVFSSNTDEWATPDDFFKSINDEFHFNLDPCSTEENHKCDTFFTKNEDGLLQNWGGIECFAIPLMAGIFNIGLRNVITKGASRTR